MVFKIQRIPMLMAFQGGDKKDILKNLEQELMSAINLKPNLCTTDIELCRTFGKGDREPDSEITASIEH